MTESSAVSIDDATWSAAVELLHRSRRAVLACHVAPDGDALGSMLALSSALRSLGVDVVATWGDERWSRPESLLWLPGIDTVVPPGAVPEQVDLLVVMDTGASDRLGVLAPLLAHVPAVLVVDHHANGSDIDGVLLVDPAAAATAVVVEELLRRLKISLTADMATCLYVGVVTDTGSFAHSVTTPAVHQVAARLLAAGAKPDAISRQLWGTRPIGVVSLLAASLQRVNFDPAAARGHGMIWTWTTTADLDEAGVTIEAADAVMETIRLSAEADVAAVFKQDAGGSFRVSTRSRGASDVGAACGALGGGGHRLAAGFTSWDSPDGIAEALKAELS